MSGGPLTPNLEFPMWVQDGPVGGAPGPASRRVPPPPPRSLPKPHWGTGGQRAESLLVRRDRTPRAGTCPRSLSHPK